MSRLLWQPQAKQAEFLCRFEDEALYGGAAGGGKSDALVIEALRQVDIPWYRALILRKTVPQLTELIDKSRRYYAAFPQAKYSESGRFWTFPSGARIFFCSMQHPRDWFRYQGLAYDYIAFDELTHFSWEEYSYMFSRNRASGPGTRVYIRATANPGGVGHNWVKARFITAGAPGETVWEEFSITSPEGVQKRRRSRIFIPSTVFDNDALLKNDPDYLSRLAALPENDRRALLYGDWDSFSGQVFTAWRNDPAAEGKNSHVLAPFPVPESWKILRGFDFGYSKPFSVGWYAVDHDGRLYRIRELYGCTGTPNEGVRWEPGRIAREISLIEKDDPNLKGRFIRGIADPSIFDESRGESVAAMMEREGIFFDRGDNSRIAGKMQVHNRLEFDEKGVPMLYVFSTCRHFIRTFPALIYSSSNVEDVDTAGEDHIYDELRYICMERPLNPAAKRYERPVFDPLSTD
ncbi:MAG: terminase family protein [Oscillospiraceae bacterium]|nr:terminase family protein [Oscillospiraceae bacterium]